MCLSRGTELFIKEFSYSVDDLSLTIIVYQQDNTENNLFFGSSNPVNLCFTCRCLFSTELLKRLDDSSEEVRGVALQALGLWLSSLSKEYKPEFHVAHLQALFQQLLLHLDDPDTSMQNQVLGETVDNSMRRKYAGPDDTNLGCMINICG